MPAQRPLKPAAPFQEALDKKLKGLSTLPTTAAVAVKLISLGIHGSPAEYARIIEGDAGLAGHLLAVANSPFYGVRTKVTRPLMAVNLLGVGTVRSLAISRCLAGLHHAVKLNAAEGRALWAATLCKAVAARRVALLLAPGDDQAQREAAEEAYAAGLLQDIAIPVMVSCAKSPMLGLLDECEPDGSAQLARERELFGEDHTQLGRRLAEQLGMPLSCQTGIAEHHNDRCTPAGIAAAFPHWLERWTAKMAARVRNALAGDPTIADPVAFMQQVCDEFGQLMAFFGHGKVAAVKLAQLLAAATSEIAAATTQLVGSVQGLQQQVTTAEELAHRNRRERAELLEQAIRDPLTGCLNRRGFAGRAAEALRVIGQSGRPAALLYIDLDKFKLLNDTCGHAAGDQALKGLVAAVGGAIRGSDILGRLGGDEFAVLLLECSENDARLVAERIRLAVRNLTISATGPRLSVSTGVVCITGGEQSLHALLGQADGLMYSTKRRGGDGVCVQSA
ncbi:MAG TPA: diguanylate cyclase [Phycisphaerae bacterium]|nr:diguanylate cyclase [Phycisphaerae bacterium]